MNFLQEVKFHIIDSEGTKQNKETKMTIIECLKKEADVRIVSGSRWMVWLDKSWFVYEHKYKKKNSTIVCCISSEEEAIKALIGK